MATLASRETSVCLKMAATRRREIASSFSNGRSVGVHDFLPTTFYHDFFHDFSVISVTTTFPLSDRSKRSVETVTWIQPGSRALRLIRDRDKNRIIDVSSQ